MDNEQFDSIIFGEDGAVNLYYDNSLKWFTKDTGTRTMGTNGNPKLMFLHMEVLCTNSLYSKGCKY